MTSPSSINRTGPSAAGRVLRGYGPVAVLALLFALMAALVPSTYRESDEATTMAGGPTSGGRGGAEGSGPETALAGEAVAGGAADGTVPAADGSVGGGGGPAPAGGNCPDRQEQVPGDPYSPPCIAFSGDNGGGLLG